MVVASAAVVVAAFDTVAVLKYASRLSFGCYVVTCLSSASLRTVVVFDINAVLSIRVCADWKCLE